MSCSSLSRLVSRFKSEIELYRLIIQHPSCRRITRIFLGAAVIYALSPIDLIPDFIPVIGHLDDAVILPLLVYIALRTVPKELIEEVRHGARTAASRRALQIAEKPPLEIRF